MRFRLPSTRQTLAYTSPSAPIAISVTSPLSGSATVKDRADQSRLARIIVRLQRSHHGHLMAGKEVVPVDSIARAFLYLGLAIVEIVRALTTL
jgi:hypothetical protein